MLCASRVGSVVFDASERLRKVVLMTSTASRDRSIIESALPVSAVYGRARGVGFVGARREFRDELPEVAVDTGGRGTRVSLSRANVAPVHESTERHCLMASHGFEGDDLGGIGYSVLRVQS